LPEPDPEPCEATLRSVTGPKVLTLTEANEYGCADDLDALSALADVARRATMRRAGFLISKMRYQAIQIRTPKQTGLSLDLARHSVEMCRHPRRGLESAPGIWL
jgi:hypothetical protein